MSLILSLRHSGFLHRGDEMPHRVPVELLPQTGVILAQRISEKKTFYRDFTDNCSILYADLTKHRKNSPSSKQM